MPISRIETASLDSALVAPTATALTTASGSAPSYSARAWVNFNGTGTVAIRASGNVSSITDNNTGDYTVNFTTAMSDANYAVISQMYYTSGVGGMATIISAPNNTTQASVVVARQDTSGGIDASGVQVAIFR